MSEHLRFEDFTVGRKFSFGDHVVSEKEIIDFALEYDPQPMHVDPIEAKHDIMGGLIASGWHSCGLTMRIYARHYLSNASSLASPGMDELRWSAPVRAGDELTVHVTIENVRVSKSKPDRGILNSFIEVLNQDDALVVSMKVVNMIACRPTA